VSEPAALRFWKPAMYVLLVEAITLAALWGFQTYFSG
jgi:hypothetical protein